MPSPRRVEQQRARRLGRGPRGRPTSPRRAAAPAGRGSRRPAQRDRPASLGEDGDRRRALELLAPVGRREVPLPGVRRPERAGLSCSARSRRSRRSVQSSPPSTRTRTARHSRRASPRRPGGCPPADEAHPFVDPCDGVVLRGRNTVPTPRSRASSTRAAVTRRRPPPASPRQHRDPGELGRLATRAVRPAAEDAAAVVVRSDHGEQAPRISPAAGARARLDLVGAGEAGVDALTTAASHVVGGEHPPHFCDVRRGSGAE